MDETASEDTEVDTRTVAAVLHNEMQESYMAYAMSVIMSRALPDARDGLKPVHRRILYAMHSLGLQPDTPHRKCARVVGEVIGKYHPHGDSSVYDALVRMAQDFSLRSPLVDGHGNFGSVDPDPPAAMRYTECKLQALARDALLADVAQDTVDFADNFDGSEREPVVLPAKLPMLLLNGASGIAVGMATNCPRRRGKRAVHPAGEQTAPRARLVAPTAQAAPPEARAPPQRRGAFRRPPAPQPRPLRCHAAGPPHNLGEVVDALRALIAAPELPDEELFALLPAPDFPTGGEILGLQGARDLYTTGRGSVVLRARAHMETLREGKREAIVVSELPYGTQKNGLLEKVALLVNEKKLAGIAAG